MAKGKEEKESASSVLPVVMLLLLAVGAWRRFGILAAFAAVPPLIGWAWLRHMKKRHGPGPLLWRWFSGAALDGRYRTDATWWRWSSKTLWPNQVWVWHHMPRLYRAAIRTGGTVLVPLLADELWRHRYATLLTLAIITLLAVLAGGWWVYRKARHLRHYWQYVRPLSRRLTPMLEGAPPKLAIEPDRSQAKVYLPPEFVGTQREWEQIEAAVTMTLGLESPDREQQMQGNKPYVVYARSIPPPAMVRSRHILPAIEAAAEHEVVLGIGKKDATIVQSLDTETPHLGFCMGTGDGKSTAAMNVAAQVLWHGGIVAFLDYKLMSHMWARGLPNVSYAGTPQEIHELLCWFADDATDDEGNILRESELTRRKQVALASADIRGNVTADLGPRILVVAEELNATQGKLKKYWRRIGGKGPSPAAEALDEILFTGRQLRVHALQIGQRLSAKATSGSGSADSRENLGCIVFKDPSDSTWKMLTDGHVKPPASGHKGRYQVVTRKEVREMQGPLWDEEDAREFATAGTVAVPRFDMPFTSRRAVAAGVGQTALPPMDAPDQPIVVGLEPADPAVPSAVTLREATDAGLFTSIAAARKAVQRAALTDVGYRGASALYELEALANCQPRRQSR